MNSEQRRKAHNKRIRDWVAANPEKRSVINKRYYQANRDYILWAQKYKGIE